MVGTIAVSAVETVLYFVCESAAVNEPLMDADDRK